MQQESFLKCQKSILRNPALSCIWSVHQVISKTHSVKTKTCAIRKMIEKLEMLLWVHYRFVFERGGESAWRNMERRWFRNYPSFLFSFSIIFNSFDFLHVCMCAIACVWRLETNSLELFLSFHHAKGQAQVFSLDGTHVYMRSHLFTPVSFPFLLWETWLCF